MKTADLSDMEKQILQQYNSDGLMETLLGFGLILGGLYMAGPERGGFFGLLPIFLLLLGRAWRRRITFPRLGYADIVMHQRIERKKRILLGVLVLLAVVAGGVFVNWLILGRMSGHDPLTMPVSRMILGLPICLFLGWVGYIRHSVSMYWAGGLLAGTMALTMLLRVSAGWGLAATGAVLLVWGIIRLVRFLRDNPKLESADLS